MCGICCGVTYAGLDSWGFDERAQRRLAQRFRNQYAAAASVAPRKGSEGGERKLWSVMVQGKYAEQIAKALKTDHGVTDVVVQAKHGLLTKKDKAANV